MDYFVSQGYPQAAQKFAIEANMQPLPDVHSITQRVEIRHAIHSGDIQSAIERINEYNPQVSAQVAYRALKFLIAMMLHVHAPRRGLLACDESKLNFSLQSEQIHPSRADQIPVIDDVTDLLKAS